ncbi:MAG: hypothetical protein IJN61_07185 [Clostridia bacterium]|nr:hypothetical protein [Clostridia bacterium]
MAKKWFHPRHAQRVVGRVAERRLWRMQGGKSGCRGRKLPSDSEESNFRAPQTDECFQN